MALTRNAEEIGKNEIISNKLQSLIHIKFRKEISKIYCKKIQINHFLKFMSNKGNGKFILHISYQNFMCII